MSNAANAALAEPWKDLWNGELSLTEYDFAEYWAERGQPAVLPAARRPGGARPRRVRIMTPLS